MPSRHRRALAAAAVILVLLVAAATRFINLTAVGLNSDEAVYTGTAASIAGDAKMRTFFPIFRAHPVLFQALVSLGQHNGASEWNARSVAAIIGILTVAVTYVLGARLYGRWAGLIAAGILAVMPYHVIVSRQVLLDGLMTLCATATLYCVVRYNESHAARWLLAAAGMLGATILSKETSVVLIGGLYAFFVLTPSVRTTFWHIGLATVALLAVVMAYPAALSASGRADTGQHYLAWQLFRKSNHGVAFYFQVVPGAIGITVLIAAVVGAIWLRAENTWRERLLTTWMAAPLLFFTLWPVKGYQYLLPIAPVVAILAGRTLARTSFRIRIRGRAAGPWIRAAAVLATIAPLLLTTADSIGTSSSGSFLAGTGGVPQAREAGLWLQRNAPDGSELLTIGPSMANMLEFYGGHKAMALSVSPNPQSRNPSYVPVPNPDLAMRQGVFQYLVWDSYTAARTSRFSEQLKSLAHKYHGVAVYTGTVRGSKESISPRTVIVIYQVRM